MSEATKARDDFILERWDQTEPSIQRQIVIGFSEKLAERDAMLDECERTIIAYRKSKAIPDYFAKHLNDLLARLKARREKAAP